MPRITTAAVLLAALTLVGGCSSGSPEAGSNAAATTDTDSPSSTESPSSGEATADPLATAGATAVPVDSAAPARPFPGLTAAQILRQSRAAVTQAKSAHVVARIKDGRDLITLNLLMARNQQAYGIVAVNGNKFTLRRINSRLLYFKADRKFWKSSGADRPTTALLANRWIKATKGTKDFADSISLTPAEARHLHRVRGITVDGQPTIGLADAARGEETKDSGTLYVATTGPALPLSEVNALDHSQLLKFKEWNRHVRVTAPADALDLNDLKGGPAPKSV
jgi:hypothetical protein